MMTIYPFLNVSDPLHLFVLLFEKLKFKRALITGTADLLGYGGEYSREGKQLWNHRIILLEKTLKVVESNH